MGDIREIQLPPKLAPLFTPKRYKILHGGRGAAKSWGVALALLVQAAEKRLRVLCTREVQKSITDSVHKLLSDQITTHGLGGFYTITESQIRGRNGSEFFFAGIRGQSVENLKSYEGVDRCWIEEAQVVSKRSWDVLIPTIRKEGSEILISFNPDLDTDETWVRFVEKPPKDSIIIELTWRDNPWFPQVLEAERQACQVRDPVGYQNIWEGKCRSSVDGAIYSAEVAQLVNDGRFRPCPHDPMLDVHTVWDLGWNDKMAIICAQRQGSEVRVINYIEDSHRTLADYVQDLNGLGYRYGYDFLPHDGAAKNYQTGQSPFDLLVRLGRKCYPPMKISGIEDGIRLTRVTLPRIYIDSDKCQRLLECLKRYRRMIPSTTGEPSGPLHDEFSHGADCVRYLAQSADKMSNASNVSKPLKYPKVAYA